MTQYTIKTRQLVFLPTGERAIVTGVALRPRDGERMVRVKTVKSPVSELAHPMVTAAVALHAKLIKASSRDAKEMGVSNADLQAVVDPARKVFAATSDPRVRELAKKIMAKTLILKTYRDGINTHFQRPVWESQRGILPMIGKDIVSMAKQIKLQSDLPTRTVKAVKAADLVPVMEQFQEALLVIMRAFSPLPRGTMPANLAYMKTNFNNALRAMVNAVSKRGTSDVTDNVVRAGGAVRGRLNDLSSKADAGDVDLLLQAVDTAMSAAANVKRRAKNPLTRTVKSAADVRVYKASDVKADEFPALRQGMDFYDYRILVGRYADLIARDPNPASRLNKITRLRAKLDKMGIGSLGGNQPYLAKIAVQAKRELRMSGQMPMPSKSVKAHGGVDEIRTKYGAEQLSMQLGMLGNQFATIPSSGHVFAPKIQAFLVSVGKHLVQLYRNPALGSEQQKIAQAKHSIERAIVALRKGDHRVVDSAMRDARDLIDSASDGLRAGGKSVKARMDGDVFRSYVSKTIEAMRTAYRTTTQNKQASIIGMRAPMLWLELIYKKMPGASLGRGVAYNALEQWDKAFELATQKITSDDPQWRELLAAMDYVINLVVVIQQKYIPYKSAYLPTPQQAALDAKYENARKRLMAVYKGAYTQVLGFIRTLKNGGKNKPAAYQALFQLLDSVTDEHRLVGANDSSFSSTDPSPQAYYLAKNAGKKDELSLLGYCLENLKKNIVKLASYNGTPPGIQRRQRLF